MTKRQQLEANLLLLQDPEYLEHIPEEAHLVILPLDDPVLFRANLKELLALKEAGMISADGRSLRAEVRKTGGAALDVTCVTDIAVRFPV